MVRPARCSQCDETLLARLTKIDRALARLDGNSDLLWEAMSRLVRHQLISAASLPPVKEAAPAIGGKAHQAFLAEIAERRYGLDSDRREPPGQA